MTGQLDAGQEKSIGRARVPATRPRRTTGPRRASGRRRAQRPARGTAPPPGVATRVYEQPDPTAPIFVDGSGRRGRRLRRTAYWLIVLTLALLALWWFSQAFLAGWAMR